MSCLETSSQCGDAGLGIAGISPPQWLDWEVKRHEYDADQERHNNATLLVLLFNEQNGTR